MNVYEFSARHWGALLLLGGGLTVGPLATGFVVASAIPYGGSGPGKTPILREYDVLSNARNAVMPYRDTTPELHTAVESLDSRVEQLSQSSRLQTEQKRYDDAMAASIDAQLAVHDLGAETMLTGCLSFVGFVPFIFGTLGRQRYREDQSNKQWLDRSSTETPK